MRWPLLTKKDQVVGFTLIDEADVPEVSKRRWNLLSTGYVGGFIARRQVLLHRLLMNFPEGLLIDHRNGDPLDNRRQNLRVATQSQNQQNSLKVLGSNPYRGVSWLSSRQCWQVHIRVNGVQKNLGHFRDLNEAKAAREAAERTYFGEFAPQRIDVCSA